IDEFAQSAPIHSAESGIVVNVRDALVRAIEAEEILSWSPRTVTKDDVQIEHQQAVFGALRADVAEEVLRVLRAEGVPGASSVVGGEHAHPVLHVGDVLQVGDERWRSGIASGVDEGKDVGEIIVGNWRAAWFEIVTIAGRLLEAAGGRKSIEC